MIKVRVVGVAEVAEDTRTFTLRQADRTELPNWEPGTHVEVRLPSGVFRQYSLCSDPEDLRTYRIAVLDVIDGRGGSRELHQSVSVGTELNISEPKNHFPLIKASSYLLCAGGIGITPILAMAKALDRQGAPTTLVYAGRNRERMPLLDELTALERVILNVVAEDEQGRPDWRQVLADLKPDAAYACGPEGMLDAVTEACESAPPSAGLHLERFAPSPLADSNPLEAGSFVVDLVASGVTVIVPADQSILATVRRAGIEVASSCEQGICGTCETKVISGSLDHRDQLLTEVERASGSTMMICVSRCPGSHLVLDL